METDVVLLLFIEDAILIKIVSYPVAMSGFMEWSLIIADPVDRPM